MRIIDHHITGHAAGGAGRTDARTADVFDPNTGQVQARVNLGTRVELDAVFCLRSEERRVGKECTVLCRSRWSPYH